MSVGGFSPDVIFGEDTLVVARMHRAGWKTAYVADAMVRHSHAYSIAEEFRRYFDIGVLHARESWLVDQFGSASGEGRRFVVSEMRHLAEECATSITVSSGAHVCEVSRVQDRAAGERDCAAAEKSPGIKSAVLEPMKVRCHPSA